MQGCHSMNTHTQKPTLVYCLTKADYFTQKTKGAITHAMGVVEGFCELGWHCDVISGQYRSEQHGAVLVDNHEKQGNAVFHEVKTNESTKTSLRWKRHFLQETTRVIDKQCDLFIVRYAVSQPLLLTVLALKLRKRNIPSVIEVNSNAYHMFPKLPLMVRKYLFKLEILIIKQYDFAYVVSDKLGENLIDAGLNKHKVIVVPNGASPASTRLINHKIESAHCPTETRFVYAGAFHIYYNFKVLIDAFRKISKEENVSLHFYGYGSQESVIRACAEDDKSIVIHGPFDRITLQKKLNHQTDVFVLPYSNRPTSNIGSPIKMYEYMSLGLPIVASDVGQVSEVLTNDKTAFLYKVDSEDDLLRVLELVISSQERGRIAARSLRLFTDNYTWRQRMAALVQLIEPNRV